MQGYKSRMRLTRNKQGIEMALGRCLVEGDRRQRRALAAPAVRHSECHSQSRLLLVGLLVAAPLLTGVAQPQLHQILPAQLTFFGAWREHSPAQRAASTTTAHHPGDSQSLFCGLRLLTRPWTFLAARKPRDVPIPDFLEETCREQIK